MADLNVYEMLKIQIQFMVPLIRDLQAQLGEETVNEAPSEKVAAEN